MRIAFVALALALSIPAGAEAQTRFRRPYAETYRLNYGFDNDGGGGGCQDYACGGACYNGHTGEDFGTPRGTRILAAQSGTVTATYNGCANTGYVGNPCGGRCGNYVQLQHADGSRTIYCHMELGSLAVSTGQRVSCGQALGRSASSGSSSGPHLHFGYKPSATSSSREVFRGSCGRSSSLWVDQRGYREAPGTSCSTCSPSAETCNGGDDDCDGRVDEGVTRACSTACGSGRETCSAGSWGSCSAPAPQPETCNDADDDCNGAVDDGDVCEIRLLHRQPSAYAAPRSTDVDGDGRADVCARGYSGVRCWRAIDGGWSDSIVATNWGDESAWDDVANYSTIRMGDIDGDGRADVCARANAGVVCARSTGDAFTSGETWREGLGDADGWGDPANYTTLRLADVNGDGADDLCARADVGVLCWISDGAAFATRVEGPPLSDAMGWDRAKHHGTIRMGDVDGDRRADVCARGPAGVDCWLSAGASFPTLVEGPRWSDDAGWGQMRFWSTIRLADVDGDGRADLCARSATDLRCHLSEGTSFATEPEIVAALSDDSGWSDESNYATLRVGDVDGDGAEDLCVRADAGVWCYARGPEGWTRRDGPAWSDDAGWSTPRHYQTIGLADIDGDGIDDACGRAGAGWRCHLSTGAAFAEAPIELDDMTDDGGWTAIRYWSTILSAGRACVARDELCNGRDDDCDGVVDEAAADEMCNGVDDDCDGLIDEHASDEICDGVDDDCDMIVDEGACGGGDASVPGADAGPGGAYGVTETLRGGCGCRAASAGSGGPWALGILLGLALAGRRRRASRDRERREHRRRRPS